jgi:hypothetical protein
MPRSPAAHSSGATAAVMGQKICCMLDLIATAICSWQNRCAVLHPLSAGLKPGVGTLPRLKGRDLKRHGIAITPLAPARLRAEVPISPPFLRVSRIRRRRFDPGADGLR